jgi:hypothetical protein
MFFKSGLDDPNQLEPLGEIRLREHDNGSGVNPSMQRRWLTAAFGRIPDLSPTSREVRKTEVALLLLGVKRGLLGLRLLH